MLSILKIETMKVKDAFPHPTLITHFIQLGVSTWTQNYPEVQQTESIRRAVYNEEGKFSPHGSSEIPIEDMTLLIRACIQRDRISPQEMTDILNDISVSMQRQGQ
jgi:hypothetical protein